MPVRDYICCLFLPSKKSTSNPKADAKEVLAEARAKLITDKLLMDPTQLSDITPESSISNTPSGSIRSLPLINLKDETPPKTTCRCW